VYKLEGEVNDDDDDRKGTAGLFVDVTRDCLVS